MRAVLIDPTEKAVTEINLASADYGEIQRAMGCKSFTSGSRPLNGSISEGFDALCVDDTDLLDPGEDQSLRDRLQIDPHDWYQIDADCDPPLSYPLSGKGLVIGIDPYGEGCDARISVDELKSRVTFTQTKIRGFEARQITNYIAERKV